MTKSRRETIIGYKKAKEALENGYEVICYHGFRSGLTSHLFDPGSEEICERIRSDAWSKLRTECHLSRGVNFTSRRSKDYFWKLGPAPKEPELVPMPGAERLAELKREPKLVALPTLTTPAQDLRTGKLTLYTYGCNTYDGKLVEFKIPAKDERFAGKMAHQMMMAARELIDIDEGLWLNDEEDYK